jgi:hypothetical protein
MNSNVTSGGLNSLGGDGGLSGVFSHFSL